MFYKFCQKKESENVLKMVFKKLAPPLFSVSNVLKAIMGVPDHKEYHSAYLTKVIGNLQLQIT